MPKKDAIGLQNAEFTAAQELANQYRRVSLTAVVDDDYTAVRREYDNAAEAFVAAWKTNRERK